MKDLTMSPLDRQNILNNNIALQQIQEYFGITGMLFEGEYRFTKKQVASFYQVNDSTIEKYLLENEEELKHNGYVVLKGAKLKNFKGEFGWMIPEGAKSPQLGVFNFRSFLNLAMLLSESEKAKELRSSILNIVIGTLNAKLGDSTKYINQRDEYFIDALLNEPSYRKSFTDALNKYLEMGNYKYVYYTDAIYKAIFLEKAAEYKNLLKLDSKENLRDTLYTEVLSLVSSFEAGLAEEIKTKYEALNRKLLPSELDSLIQEFTSRSLFEPLIESVRTKMASRDYSLRSVQHSNMTNYIKPTSSNDYELFLSNKSNELIKRVKENPQLIEVFKRLKDR